jgi:hypothetical protein
MSLAIYASPFYSENEEIDVLNKKKLENKHNKTQKAQISESFNTKKVNSILERIHQRNDDSDSDDGNDISDYKLPSPPISSGVSKTIEREGMMNNTNLFQESERSKNRSLPKPMNEEENLNYYPKTEQEQEQQSKEYYEKILPRYLKEQFPRTNAAITQASPITNDILLKKMNYMIHLLEDKQDEKTEHITEEVILYSFLGIFIIYIVDSFAKVGKYVR